MEWIAQLQGQVVGLDTAPLIYLIEQHPVYLQATRLFFEALERSEFRVVTSVVTLLEVLVYPLRQGNNTLAQEYRDILLNTVNLTTVQVSPEITEVAAQLRAAQNLRPLDAIQMATAIREEATSF